MSMALRQVYGSPVPQSEPMAGREAEMVANEAGGFVFATGDWGRLERFLILGTEGGTYYVGERELSKDNAAVVGRCLGEDGLRVVEMIASLGESGRAPSHEPALFALAMAASLGDERTRTAANQALPGVARTGTHLLHFAGYVDGMRGWGRALKRAVQRWYTDRSADELAFQTLKYRGRDGWTQRDVLRLAHPRPKDAAQEAVLRVAVRGLPEDGGKAEGTPMDISCAPERIHQYAALQRADVEGATMLLRKHRWLGREMVPSELLKADAVWEALAESMPIHALIRNLATLTRRGLLRPLGDLTGDVVARVTNQALLNRRRMHPFAVLVALRTYALGRSLRGDATWEPVGEITAALERAYELAFGTLERIPKRVYVAVDISGSMSQYVTKKESVRRKRDGRIVREIRDAPLPITCAESAAAIAQVIARSAERSVVRGFETRMKPLDIDAQTSFGDVMRITRTWMGGGTDCAQPMLDAMADKLSVDAFVILTDGETWAGEMHPAEALREYREKSGIDAKCMMLSMTATGFTCADPNDPGMLDVVGVDSGVVDLVADFITH